MTRLALITLSSFLLTPACSTGDGAAPSDGRVRLEAASSGCSQVDTVCLETEPPQCFDVCVDDDPGDDGSDDGDCVSSDGDMVQCGDDTCVDGTDDGGQEVLICAGDDCTVSYDVETGEESFSCPPSDGGDGDGGGSSEPGEPGSSGPDDGVPASGEHIPDGAGTRA